MMPPLSLPVANPVAKIDHESGGCLDVYHIRRIETPVPMTKTRPAGSESESTIICGPFNDAAFAAEDRGLHDKPNLAVDIVQDPLADGSVPEMILLDSC
jgi:hypothetical protein